MQVLLFATLISYALATFFRVKEKVAGLSFRHHATFSLIAALTCNAILVFRIFALSESHLQYQALFAAGALSLGLSTLAIESLLKESFFSIFSIPASIVFLFCSTFVDGALMGAHFSQGWFAIHLLLSILGESLYFLAAVSSLAYFYMVRRLKKKNRLRAVFYFPPLTRLDELTFKLIVAGTVMFFCGLGAGFYGNLAHFADFSPGSKHIFSLLLLAFYLVLILARQPLKITGTRLAILTISGFILSIVLIVVPDTAEHWKPLTSAVQEIPR